MAEALVAAGHLTREQAAQMLREETDASADPLRALGAPLPPAPAAAAPTPGGVTAPNEPTDPGDPLDLATLPIDPLFAPPETPDGYHLQLDPTVPMDVQDIAAVRHWFHTLRLPQSIAQSIYSETERMSRQPPDAAALDRLTASTRAELARAWGQNTDTMLGHARRLIDAAAHKHPGIKRALARGPGSNPLIVRQLAEHAARLYGAAPEGQART
jgi:hypothetical protein